MPENQDGGVLIEKNFPEDNNKVATFRMFGKGNSTSEIAETLGVDEAQNQEIINLGKWRRNGRNISPRPKPPTKPGSGRTGNKKGLILQRNLPEKHPKFKIGIANTVKKHWNLL